ncbi:DNA-binding protein [Paraburkholderia aromaticivorans]|uniref:DNA-binding protein n=1 Tax=Paraburkholderia aromaticivorans TaxID=2026199 RepID=A0A248VI44_9BURK|nr:DNA-binding protein [Paraburkholderia aromaticivorans]ASV98648.1 DNA-binding protein [Paraburkholderia aromaticivorans]
MTISPASGSTSPVREDLYKANKDTGKPEPAANALPNPAVTPPVASQAGSKKNDAPGRRAGPSTSAALSSRQTCGEALPVQVGHATARARAPDALSSENRSARAVPARAGAIAAGDLNGLNGKSSAGAANAPQVTQPTDMLPAASTEEFKELNRKYDTVDGYAHRSSETNSRIAQEIEAGIQQEMTGYPPQVIRFQERQTHLQGMLSELPDSERQFYGGVLATVGAAYQLETDGDKRYVLDQKLAGLEHTVREEVNRARNDPVDRVLGQFNPPMGEAYLNKEDRERSGSLDKLREQFLGAADAGERESIFAEASDLKSKLQGRISVEVGKRQRVEHAQWKEANGEVDRILREAEAQTDPARRYELIGRQLFQINPGEDALKDKVVLAFTERMHDSPPLRDKLDTWHDHVSGPLNAQSVGAAKKYTDILSNLPPVSADYVRDLSDRYNAVLQDVTYKDDSITPAARAEKTAGQVLEGVERVLLGLTPLAPLADLQPSTLPDNVRMGLDYGSALLGMLGGEGWGIAREIGLAGKAVSAAARDAEAANLAGEGGATAGKGLVQSAGKGVLEGLQAEQTLSRDARAAEQALLEKTLAEAGPAVDPTSLLAHQSVADGPHGSLVNYADPDVSLKDLRAGPTRGILVDAKGDRYIELGGKAYHARFDRDTDSWRVFNKGADLKPQYPVRLNETTQKWELDREVGLRGGAAGKKISDEVRQEVIRLLNEEDLSCGGIAKKLGISEGSVRRIAKQEKITSLAAASFKYVPISDGTRRDIVKLLKDGVSRGQIAAQFGVSQTTVGRIAKEAGIASSAGAMSGRTVITPEIREKVIQMLKKDMSRREIARQLDISAGSVFKIAEKHKIPLTAAASLRTLKTSDGDRQTIIKLLEEGVLKREIAAQTGVSQATISTIAKQEGIVAAMPKGVTPEQIDQIFALKDQGKTNVHIADALKFSKSKVSDILVNYNPATYKRSWWNTTPENRTAAIQQLDEGKTSREIARDLKLPFETVRGIANEHRMARDSLARELLEQGKSAEEVAESLDMHPDYVRRLTDGIREGTHDSHFTSKDRDAAMDMFEKGYDKEEVAAKLGISPWKARSLVNEFQTQTMDSVTPEQLDDIARILSNVDYCLTTGDLAKATDLPESTVALVEQQYAGGYIARSRFPQPGTSSDMSLGRGDHYEWIPPLSPEQEIEAVRAMNEGGSLKDVAAQLNQPYAAIERLHEGDLPLVAPQDDVMDVPTAQLSHHGTTALSEADKAEIRNLAHRSGVSASFIANLIDARVEDIQKILSSNP